MGIFAITWPKTSGGSCIAQFTYPTRQSHPAKQMAAILAIHLRTRLFVVPFMTLLLRHSVHLKVALRSDPERIRNPVKEGEHRCDVYGLSNLRFRPAMIPELLHILIGGPIRRLGHLRHVVKQCAFRRTQACFFQIAICYGLHSFFFCSLNTQEVCMRVQSIDRKSTRLN